MARDQPDDAAAGDQHAKHEDDPLNDGDPGTKLSHGMLHRHQKKADPEVGGGGQVNDTTPPNSPALPPIDPLSGAPYVLKRRSEPVAQPVEQLTFNQ